MNYPHGYIIMSRSFVSISGCNEMDSERELLKKSLGYEFVAGIDYRSSVIL